MYESPIHLIYDDIKLQLDKNVEDCVYSAVQNVGVNVDREELIRALRDSKEQYYKGYRDAENKKFNEHLLFSDELFLIDKENIDTSNRFSIVVETDGTRFKKMGWWFIHENGVKYGDYCHATPENTNEDLFRMLMYMLEQQEFVKNYNGEPRELHE